PILHSVAIPASTALIMISFSLRARRRRAWQAAVTLLVGLGAIHLLKGLDFEEALLAWGAAAFLWWGRRSFVVRHERLGWRSLLWLVLALSLLVTLGVGAIVWAASGGSASLSQVSRDTLDLLAWSKPSTAFHD